MLNNECIRPRYSHNDTEQLEIDLARAAFYDRRIPTAVMLIVLSAIGIPGNAVVVMVYCKEKRMTASHFLMFTIAILDFIITLIVIPMNIAFNLFWLEINSIIFCKIFWAINVSSRFPEIYLIGGLAVVRYYHVCKPHELYSIQSKIKPFLMCCFLMSFVLGAYAALCNGCQSWSDLEPNTPGFYCNASDHCRKHLYYIYFYLVIVSSYLLIIITIIVVNVLILRRMVNQRKIMLSYRNPRASEAVEVDPNASDKAASGTFETVSETLRSDASDLSKSIKSGASDWSKSGKSGKSDSQQRTSKDGSKISVKTENQSFIRKASVTSFEKRKMIENRLKQEMSNELISSVNLDLEETLRQDDQRSNKGDTKGGSARSSFTKGKGNDQPKGVEKRRRRKRRRVSKTARNQDTRQRRISFKSDKSNYKKTCSEKCTSFCQFQDWNITTLKLFIVSLVYVMTYTPFFAVNLYVNLGKAIPRNMAHNEFKYFLNPCVYLAFLGAAVNPLIYTIIDSKFRSQIRALFQKKIEILKLKK